MVLQVMGGTGVTRDTVVELIFRELRAFRIYDGPNMVSEFSNPPTLATKEKWEEK